MRRALALVAFLLALAAGLAVTLVHGTRSERATWESLQVPPWHPVAEVRPGQTACEAPVYVEEPFSWVAIVPDRPEPDALKGRIRPPVRVVVADDSSGRTLASGLIPADRTPGGPRDVELDRQVPQGRSLRFCFENEGRSGLMLWGVGAAVEAQDNPYIAGAWHTQSELTLSGRRLEGDLFIEMGSGPRETRSLLATLPEALERAARFKFPWMGAWTFWALLALLLGGGAAAIGFALTRAAREDEAST